MHPVVESKKWRGRRGVPGQYLMSVKGATLAKKESRGFLMRRVTDGVIGWMTFQRAAKRPLYSEALLYPAVLEVAAGRGWDVYPQFKHPHNNRSSFDFCLLWKAGHDEPYSRAVLLEIKFVSQRTGRVGSIADDLRKLMAVEPGDVADSLSLAHSVVSDGVSLKRYFMLAGQTKHMERIWTNEEASAMGDEARDLWRKASHRNGRPRRSWGARTGAGWVRHSPAFLRTDLSVMTLKETVVWGAVGR
jgi:hypothetical protein